MFGEPYAVKIARTVRWEADRCQDINLGAKPAWRT